MLWAFLTLCSFSRLYFPHNLVSQGFGRLLNVIVVGFTFLTVLDRIYGLLICVVISFVTKDLDDFLLRGRIRTRSVTLSDVTFENRDGRLLITRIAVLVKNVVSQNVVSLM